MVPKHSLSLFFVCILFPHFLLGQSPEINVEYKVIPSQLSWKTVPSLIELNPLSLAEEHGVKVDDIDPFSLEVTAVMKAGTALERKTLDHRIRVLDGHWQIAWRADLQGVEKINLIFSTQKNTSKTDPLSEPLIGDGDLLKIISDQTSPLSGGYNENIAAGDVDGDGDPDLLVAFSGTPGKEGIFYYENRSGVIPPVLEPGKQIFPSKEHIRLIDWNQDNRNELLIKDKLYRMVVDVRSLKLESLMDLAIPLKNPVFVDLDADGIKDLIGVHSFSRNTFPSFSVWNESEPPYTPQGVWLGESSRNRIQFCRNTGSNQKPMFKDVSEFSVHDYPIELYGFLTLACGDLDDDGIPDLVAGNSFQLLLFKGLKASISKFEQARPLKTASGKDPFGIYVRPDLVDWDSDGDLDIILGNEDGRPTWIENLGQENLGEERFIQQYHAHLDAGCLSVPVARDWDQDGDIDLMVGNSSGFVEYFENKSSSLTDYLFLPGVPLEAEKKTIRIQAGNAGSIQGPDEAKYGYTMPEVADWDGDNDLDLLLSDIRGEHLFFENQNSGIPVLSKGLPLDVQWDGPIPKPSFVWMQPGPTELITYPRCRPSVVDWDRDGDMDYISIDHEGYLSFYEQGSANQLLPGKRVFLDMDNHPIRITDQMGRKSGRARIIMVDWDADGDLDVLHNAHDLFDNKKVLLRQINNVGWFENTGSLDKPRFQWQGDLFEKRLPRTSEHSTSPEPVDLDADGKLDLFLGGEDGRIHVYHRAFIENDLPKFERIDN